ncbi:hypothetical protein E2562_000840 [Oryza meyeriana var. granulata]|uniref:Uncharacterized protein n=1 Tax=Oryza meyeriana var. granulata TaxID=110450 RepID=A0A6G1CY58_9ORYZ|nr:hypothetical protein E2562_000840 [Oryza meyeriana var. granulata]
MANCGRRFADSGAPARRCNLDRFLEATTPVVRTACSSKKSMNGWRQSDSDNALPFFTLGDIWDEFRESSAYGIAVPIVMNGCSDGVVQYYVPYLSAIQLYGRFWKHFYHSRPSGEDSDGDYCQDTCSEEISDLEHDSCPSSTDAFSVQDTCESSTNEASSDESESRSSHEQLIFEFLESEPPYQREPLADKISSLAKRFPELNTLRSCDLSPTSWMSVAWYPIYRIPTGPTLRDLDACFLTYHPLSTQLTGGVSHNSHDQEPKGSGDPRARGVPVTTAMCLPTFAMASYRLRVSAWAPGGRDRQLVASLSQAADAWLGLLRVHHPDHRFFAARRVLSR